MCAIYSVAVRLMVLTWDSYIHFFDLPENCTLKADASPAAAFQEISPAVTVSQCKRPRGVSVPSTKAFARLRISRACVGLFDGLLCRRRVCRMQKVTAHAPRNKALCLVPCAFGQKTVLDAAVVARMDKNEEEGGGGDSIPVKPHQLQSLLATGEMV